MNRFKQAQIEQGQVKGPKCWRLTVADLLTPKALRELDEALSDPTIDATTISRVMSEEWDFLPSITRFQITRHRRKECRCPR